MPPCAIGVLGVAGALTPTSTPPTPPPKPLAGVFGGVVGVMLVIGLPTGAGFEAMLIAGAAGKRPAVGGWASKAA